MTFLQESTIFFASSEVPTRSAPPVAPPVTPVRSAPKSTADSTAPAATVQLSGKKASTAAQYSRQYSIEYRDRLSRLKSRKRVGHLSLWDKYLQARSSQVQSAAPKCPSAPTKSAGPASAPKVGRASTGPIAGRSWAEFGGSSWPLKKNPTKNCPSAPDKSAAPTQFAAPSRNCRGGWDKFIGLRGGMFETEPLCNDCYTTWHKCSVCHKKRCKQFHLEAREVGDNVIMICKECDPTVVGLERIRQPTGVMPDQHSDHPDVLRRPRAGASAGPTAGPSSCPTAGPSNPAPSLSPPSKKLKTPSKRSDGVTEQSSTPTTPSTPCRPSVIQFTPRRNLAPSTPVVDVPSQPSLEVFRGKEPDCLFVGPPGPQKWDKKSLKNYFFIIPSRAAVKVLTLRASIDSKFMDLWEDILGHYREVYNLVLSAPTLWLRGRQIAQNEMLFSHPPKSLFLIAEGAEQDQEYAHHKGLVWECTLCKKAWTYSFKAPKGCSHEVLFKESLSKSTTSNLDRPNQAKPWGCPLGHVGLGEEFPENQPLVRQGPRTPRRHQPPTQPSTPRATVRRRLDQPDQPFEFLRQPYQPAPQQASEQAPRHASQPAPQPKRQRAAKKVASSRLTTTSSQTDSDTTDISGSDDEDMYVPNAESSEDYEGSSDERSRGDEEEVSRVDEGEEMEDEQYEDWLSDELMDEIYECMVEDPTVGDNVYECDEEDEEWFNKQISAPLLLNSKLMKKFGSEAPDDVLELMRAGKRPDANSKVNRSLFATTSLHYTKGLRDLLGLYQEKLIKAGMSYRLINGKIKLRQFFRYKQPDYLNLPEDLEPLLDQLPTGNKRTFALAGFRRLVNSLMKYLRQPEGMELFMTRNETQQNLTQQAMIEEADRERTEKMRKLRELIEYLDVSAQFGAFTGQKRLAAEKKKEFEEEFMGAEIPDAKEAITAYLSLESTRKMLKEVETLGENKTVVEQNKMSSISRDMMKFCVILRGVRIQCFGDGFTRGQFWTAVNSKIPASFPYVPITGQEGIDLTDKNVRSNVYSDVDSGTRLYARPDLYRADDNDPNDPRKSDDWPLMQGIAIKVPYHKTGPEYPMWLWFSQVQTEYLRYYEEIVRNYCVAKNINIDPTTGLPHNKSPFFIAGSGAATFQPKMFPLDFSDFAKVAKIPKCTSMLFRKMFSNILLAQKDIAIRECEEWTMCHRPTTAKNFYADKLTKKMKAIKANTWYQSLFTEKESLSTTSSISSTFTSREQAEAQAAGLLALGREQLENRIRYEDRVEASQVATKDKILNNKTRAAIIRLIQNSGRDMMELLMTNRPIKNIACYTAVMKMISLAPKEDPDAKVIRENLLLFANLCSGETLTPRQLLYTYCVRLVASQLHKLRSVPHTDSTRLLVALGDIFREHGNKYTFGNSKLAEQLKFWSSKQIAREQSVVVPDNINTVAAERQQRKQQQEKLRAAARDLESQGPPPSTSRAPPLVSAAPEDEDDEDDEDDEGPRKSVTFNTFADREMEFDVGGTRFMVPPNTPVKLTPVKKKKIPWTDPMRVQLLKEFLDRAHNPLKRPDAKEGKRSRAVYRNDPNMDSLYHNSTIKLANGSKVPLSSLCKPDYVHNTLASGQLTGQSSIGLVGIIDEVMGSSERTLENLAAKKEEILALAWSYAKEDSESSD